MNAGRLRPDQQARLKSAVSPGDRDGQRGGFHFQRELRGFGSLIPGNTQMASALKSRFSRLIEVEIRFTIWFRSLIRQLLRQIRFFRQNSWTADCV